MIVGSLYKFFEGKGDDASRFRRKETTSEIGRVVMYMESLYRHGCVMCLEGVFAEMIKRICRWRLVRARCDQVGTEMSLVYRGDPLARRQIAGQVHCSPLLDRLDFDYHTHPSNVKQFSCQVSHSKVWFVVIECAEG